MRRQKNNEKVREIIDNAQSLSKMLIVQQGKSERSIHNLERISAIAKLLVTSNPSLEPNYDNLVERGNLMYPRFPARQTLKNRYRMMVGIWRGAYHNVQHLLVEHTIRAAMDDKIPSATASDAGATIHILREYIVRIRAEMDQIKHELTETKASLSSFEGNKLTLSKANNMDGEIVVFTPIKKWLSELLSPDSLLEEDETGLRLNKFARPGRLVMNLKVLKALRSL